MTQSVFKDLFQLKKELRETHSFLCFFVVLLLLVFVWRFLVAFAIGVAATAIWPTIPFWPVVGLVVSLTFLIPAQ
jgi:hypothetical protein